jgi:hypothetical protein
VSTYVRGVHHPILIQHAEAAPPLLSATLCAAFTKLITALKTTPEKLLADKALLTKVLSYHVVPSKLTPVRAALVATGICISQADTMYVQLGQHLLAVWPLP